MSSPDYLDFLGTVWSSLPQEDQARLGELWQGYEQIFAAVFQKYLEGSLNIAQQDLQAYSTERWLPYSFGDQNFINRAATFTSSQDVSQGINLTVKYLLRLGVDGQTPVEVDCRGVTPGVTSLAEIISKLNLAFRFPLASGAFSNSVLALTSPTSGVNSRITVYDTSDPTANAAEFVLGLLGTSLPVSVPDFPLPYHSPYGSLFSVPQLQDCIRDESVTVLLVEGVDYVISDQSVISFKAQPPPSLWARRSLFDQENPWNNFGFLMDIYQKNSQRYVSVLEGLWFAFWTGPKPENLKRSLYLLLGLPTAREAATVTTVTPTLVETTSAKGVIRVFAVPTGLLPVVFAGQQVAQFDPLVSGIEVFDKVNKPGFIESEIGRTGIRRFLTEGATLGLGDTDETRALTLLEEFTFLPQISIDAFIYPDVNLGNVRTFLDAIKPLNKNYVFQISSGDIEEPLVYLEAQSSRLDLDLSSTVDGNETTHLLSADLLAYETMENSGLNLDPNGVLFQETLSIDVYSFGSLIDSFSA